MGGVQDSLYACADMLLDPHEAHDGALLVPSGHGSSDYSSDMHNLLPGNLMHKEGLHTRAVN